MPNVLITGASRGIGRAAAVRMAGAGWDVLAGVRSPADGAAVVAENPARITAVELDVTNAEQIAALDDTLPARLDAVVNNAGIAVGGALEALPIEELRLQFEVNVIGQVAVTQVLLPRLRSSRGRIVFVSSVNGLLASPMLGAYSASKFAIEAIGDAFRMELRPWKIRVSIVQPAQIDTDIWRSAPEVLEQTIATMSAEHRALYARHIEGMRKAIPRSQKMAAPVEDAAKAIERALTVKRPRARYVPNVNARAGTLLARLPTPVLDRVVAAASGVPRKVRA
jgi:NAD(P)-dependent dehydrogenase (short-subunit alcohol dehydrogenase family)